MTKSQFGETLKIDEKQIFVSPVFKDEENAILSFSPRPAQDAELLKRQITQLSWRPHALILSLERKAKEIAKIHQPQNFKLSDMLLSQAEELRVLLRQCEIPEPPKESSN